MSADHNRWIICARRFREHETIDAAQAEMKRLREKHPDKTFHMYRIKNALAPAAQATETESA